MASVTDHQHLEAAVDRKRLERADAALVREVDSNEIRNEVDCARGGIDCQRPCPLLRRQVLYHRVGVSGCVLADDGEASITASVRGEDESAALVIGDGVGAGTGGERCNRLAGAVLMTAIFQFSQ